MEIGHETFPSGNLQGFSPGKTMEPGAIDAVNWAVAHLAEREAVFSRADLLAAALAWLPGAVSVEAAEKAIGALQGQGRLYTGPGAHEWR